MQMVQWLRKMLKVYLRDVILSYEEMLEHVVGRITTKPRGKPEMGEAF
jgi:hypothetical protein